MDTGGERDQYWDGEVEKSVQCLRYRPGDFDLKKLMKRSCLGVRISTRVNRPIRWLSFVTHPQIWFNVNSLSICTVTIPARNGRLVENDDYSE